MLSVVKKQKLKPYRKPSLCLPSFSLKSRVLYALAPTLAITYPTVLLNLFQYLNALKKNTLTLDQISKRSGLTSHISHLQKEKPQLPQLFLLYALAPALAITYPTVLLNLFQHPIIEKTNTLTLTKTPLFVSRLYLWQSRCTRGYI